MLKILQTGDLHLGKTLYEYGLDEDQEHMLNLIIQELGEWDYDVLLITGDIYDRSVPSQEAVRLFDNFLTSVHKKFPTLQVCFISGNHDSATRLSYASTILDALNIHITTNPEDCDKPFILTSKEDEKFALYQIPFLFAGNLRDDDGVILKSQEELIGESIKRINKAHTALQASKTEYKTLPALLNTHLFTLAGQSSDSERILLGTAELINPTVFEGFAFTAIGHLHKKQKVSDRAYYAGSPLAYSFSEINTEKAFLRLAITENGTTLPAIEITEIPIVPLRKLVQITAAFDDFEKMIEHKDNFIEFTYTDTVIVENAAARLRKVFPYLLSVKQLPKENLAKGEVNLTEKRTLFEKKDALNMNDIAKMFLEDVGEESNAEIISLFETISKEVQNETN